MKKIFLLVLISLLLLSSAFAITEETFLGFSRQDMIDRMNPSFDRSEVNSGEIQYYYTFSTIYYIEETESLKVVRSQVAGGLPLNLIYACLGRFTRAECKALLLNNYTPFSILYNEKSYFVEPIKYQLRRGFIAELDRLEELQERIRIRLTQEEKEEFLAANIIGEINIE